MVNISSWGRLGCWEHETRQITDRTDTQALINSTRPGLAFGMGRSYGDSCLNPGGTLWKTRGLDRLISFDASTGRLRCEAGVLLHDIQRLLVPRGWALPVTPGTQWVTVGGAVANDVHGKNHHVMGTFGDHVLSLTLLRTNGQLIRCTPTEYADWFAATVGGLGLTGVITEVEIAMRHVVGPWIDSETIAFTELGEFFSLADASESKWEYTVAWIDCLASRGRGLFMRGNHSTETQRKVPTPKQRSLPFTPPMSLVNQLSLRAFNLAYFYGQKLKPRLRQVHCESFFYPLDNLRHWNRMYGPRGFYQYQSVVPREVGQDAVRATLCEISRSGQGSFLAVLKTFSDRQARGMLSFPRPGVTLALDFPNRGEVTTRLFDRLDAIVREAGGRIYPAKDARMPRELFEAGYPLVKDFLPYRDPGICSALSRRLMGS